MTSPKLAAGLSALTDRYDVLLCDVWGVIHNGRDPFPAACEALAKFRGSQNGCDYAEAFKLIRLVV